MPLKEHKLVNIPDVEIPTMILRSVVLVLLCSFSYEFVAVSVGHARRVEIIVNE